MAYPEHYLLQWGGTLHGSEIWTTGLRMQTPANLVAVQDELDKFMTDAEADLNTFYAQSFFHGGLTCDYVKLNRIDGLGHYADKERSNTRFFAAPIRGAGSAPHAPQVACVASLLTDADRGLANRGRLYFGGLAQAAFSVDASNGKIPALQRDNFTTHCANFLNNLNNNVGVDQASANFEARVVSKGSGIREGIARKVTGVRVGRVLDTQRSRRSALAEEYGPVLPVG
jgi:hypothetical protein